MSFMMISLRLLLTMTLITGVIYPALIWIFGITLFREEASGSLIYKNGQVVGSELIAQKFATERYFHARPSAGDFATQPSGASNFGPTSQSLKEAIEKRRQIYGSNAPADLLTTSASGLDPHLSPDGITIQMERVARARQLNDEGKKKLQQLVQSHVEKPLLGFLGSTRINVLRLNLDLDSL